MSSEDDDNISVETNHERGLREAIKEDLTREAEVDPVGHSFKLIKRNAHNLKNVKSLRAQYPEEYAERMRLSAVPPQVPEGRRPDFGWYAETLAGSVLSGLFDADDVEYVKRHLDDERLGIPQTFLDLPEVRKFARKLAVRPWASREVGEHLLQVFDIEPQPEMPKQRIGIDKAPFS